MTSSPATAGDSRLEARFHSHVPAQETTTPRKTTPATSLAGPGCALAGDADGHFREALRQHEVSGRPFEHARTALLYGEWLRRGRRGTDARPHLRTALALFDRTGAAPWAERARAELRAAGEPVARSAPAPDRLSLLTPQELQVVRLAASGATNRDIAAQLFISPRTVSHHLYRAFPKLGVTNRTALARLDLAGPDDLP